MTRNTQLEKVLTACEILNISRDNQNELWVILKTDQGIIRCNAKQVIWDQQYLKPLSNEQAICIAYRQGHLDGMVEGGLHSNPGAKQLAF